MNARHLSTALLCLGAITLGATAYLGSPWPGVALAGLSLLPWGWDAWLAAMRPAQDERAPKWEKEAEALIRTAWKVTDMEKLIEEQGQQINSLRSAVSVRGTLGG